MGTGSSLPRFSNVQMPKGSGEGTSRGTGGQNQDDQGFDYSDSEDEWEQPQPLNMIMPDLLIEFGSNPMTVEKPEDNFLSQEEVTVPTKEELATFLRDESDDDFEDMFEQTNQGFDYDASTAAGSESPELPPGFEQGFNQESYNNIHSPEEVVLRIMHSKLCQGSSSFENSFFKDKDNELNLKEKQLGRILKAPFIEEQAYRIFSRTDFSPRTYNNIGEKAFKEELQFFYRGSMKRMLNEPPLVVGQLKHKIEIITQVECKRLCRINIPIIHVFRADGQKYQFNEAHFHLLHLDDIMDMLNHFKNAIIRPVEVITALNAVKRFIKYSIQAASKEDFQLGLESVQRKINLSMPNQSVPEAVSSSIDFCTVLTSPTPGFIFMNGKTQRSFIRLNELHKYSDGTLSLARKCFHWLLKNKKASTEQIPLIKQVLQLILRRLKFRVAMRQFEVIQGLRDKSFFQGSTIVKKYQPKIIKGSYARGGPFLPNDPRNLNPEQL